MILIGNIVAFVGCIIMVLIGFVKKKERILALQCVQFAFMGTGNLLLGGMSGFISNGVSIARNLVLAKHENTLILKVGFIVVQVVLTMLSGGNGLIEWLPIISAVVYTWFLNLKNPVTFKMMIICCQLMWLVYDWCYLNYVAVTFDVLTVISTVIGIRMLLKEK